MKILQINVSLVASMVIRGHVCQQGTKVNPLQIGFLASKQIQTRCKLVKQHVPKCEHFASLFVCRCFTSKAKSFASRQKTFASDLQVKKTLCKWFPCGLQVVHKHFANCLLASKPMQIHSKLVCLASNEIHFLEIPLLASNSYLRLCKCFSYQLLIIQGFKNALVSTH